MLTFSGPGFIAAIPLLVLGTPMCDLGVELALLDDVTLWDDICKNMLIIWKRKMLILEGKIEVMLFSKVIIYLSARKHSRRRGRGRRLSGDCARRGGDVSGRECRRR